MVCCLYIVCITKHLTNTFCVLLNTILSNSIPPESLGSAHLFQSLPALPLTLTWSLLNPKHHHLSLHCGLLVELTSQKAILYV